MQKKLLVLTMLFLSAWRLLAQIPDPCPTNDTPPADLCSDICIYCNFNGYMGSTSGYTGQTPPGFCGTIENEQWLGFIAGAAAATFTATPSNCNNGNGVQIALYTSCTSSPIGCNGGTSGGGNTPVSITANLTPGVNYFLLIDGNAGDQCDFTITVTPPSAVQAPNVGNTGAISGPIKACPGATIKYSIPVVTGAGVYVWDAPADWLINGQTPPVTIPAPGGNMVQVTIGNTSGQLCVQPLNSCNEGLEKCKDIIVAPIPPTTLPKSIVCNEDLPYELPWGDFANQSGTYETTYQSYQGCDSVVKKQIVVKAPIIKYLSPQSICAGSCVTVCGEQYCDAGSYTHVCTSYQGCDSIINFSIIVLDPVADIIPNGLITCATPSVVLGSAPSPGTKIWKTPTGVVLGTGNTLTVTQPGTVILTVTASAGGVLCIKNDTITVSSNTTPPTASATGGVLGCGAAQAQLSTTTNATNPTFAWSPAAGLNATNIPNPIATLPGTYVVTVTSSTNGCTNTASVNVTGNTTPPGVSTSGGILTCSNTSIQISATTNVPNATYEWSGPGFSSTQQNPTVNIAGTYTVTITSLDNNCTATGTAAVTLDNAPPTATASGGVISCPTPTVTLNGNSPTNGVTYAWTGPNLSSSQQNPVVDTAGVYNLVVTNPVNGCTSTATATVTGNTILPDASATGGTVSCGTPNIDITGSSTTPNVTYSWSGPASFTSNVPNPSVSIPGFYVLTVTATNQCTATVTAIVAGDFAAPDAAATGGIITCSSSSTTINGSSNTPGVVFTWIGPSGNPYNGPNPSVSNIGVYTLTVTSPNGCTATATASVVPDANVPNVSAAGGTLNCNINSVTLDGGSITPGVTLQWTGPGGFVSTQEDPTVTVSGIYTLTVSAPNGCTALATADVILDIDEPGATATGGTVTCTAPTLTLNGKSPSNNVTWNWSGPNNFSSQDPDPTVMEAGNYTLTVTGTNGCTSSAVATIVADQTPPVPASTTGTLTCALTSLTLNGSADVQVNYSWSGPNGFTSIDQNPTVSQPGDYVLTATAANGCTASITATVAQDITAPEVDAQGNTISCAAPDVVINGTSPTAGVSYSWIGPGGFTSSVANPVVSASGSYILVVTAPNGCTAQAIADVLKDTEVPTLNALATDILTCATTSIEVATTAINATSPIQSYFWIGPGGFISTEEDPIVSVPGSYTVTVTSANGCTAETSVTVNQDIVAPNVSASGGTLTCLITSTSIDGGSTTPNTTFAWQGPGGFTSTLQDPVVDVDGVYTLTVTGPNGCTASASATVILDGDFPDATAVSTNNLDCNMPESELQGSSGVSGVNYSWSDAGGNIVGITANVTITQPGTYQLAVTAPNGCVTNANVTVTQDIALPGATAVGDTIDCISGQANLTANTATPNVKWSWSGPGNFNSTQQNPIVTVDGTYTVTVTGQNGCTSTAEAIVAKNTLSPDVVVSGAGTLTCLVTSLTLSGTINTLGATGVWQNASGAVISNQASINVAAPGTYTYVVTAQNGCKSSPSLTVTQNIVTPQNVVVNGGLINCTNPTLNLSATTTTSNVTYSWTGPNGFTSTQQNPQTGTSGTYTVLLTNQANGCEATAVTFVTEDFVKPDITATTQTITCALPTVTLNATSATPNVKYNWAGPGINAGNQKVEDPQVSVAGPYTVTVTAQNGCTQTFSIPVPQDVAPPNISTTGVTLTCAVPVNTITGNSQTPGVTYAWTGPNGFTSTQQNPSVSVPGDYILTVTAPNGCTSISTAVVLPDASIPVVTATGGTITCAVTSIQAKASSSNPNVTWAWSGPGGFTSTQQNPTISAAGNYSVTATATNGCTGTASVQVLADTQGPVITTAVPNQLNCTTTQVTLNASVQAPGNYTYQWSTQTGNIVSGAFSQTPVVSSAAAYTVVVTNQQNGCTSSKDVPVTVDSSTVSGALWIARDVSCYKKTDGVINVTSVIGGTPSYLYSLDNLPFVPATTFTSLKPGMHTLVIQDANGCEWETAIEIGEPEELTIELGADTTIHLGHTVQLSLDNTVSDLGRVKSLILNPSNLLDSVFCDTCSGLLRPLHSFRYTVTVVDTNGCKASDFRTIIVDKTRYVYIPNVFDPGAANNNSWFFISADPRQVVNIKSFLVFDRWGNAVFENYNFFPNNPSEGWDGRIRGDLATPAVFVYYAEIEFIDGETILYKGDVALLRNN